MYDSDTRAVYVDGMGLGRRIQAARKAAGKTQAQLAADCGWDPPSRLANYEQGTREPSLADLRVIAQHVKAGGHTYARIVLDDAELSQAVSVTPAIVLAAVAAAKKAVGLTGDDSFDPVSDPDVFAQALRVAMAAALKSGTGANHGSSAGSGTVGRSRRAAGEAKAGTQVVAPDGRRRKSA